MSVTHRLNSDARSYSPGLVYIEYSAVLQGTGAPTLARGEGVASIVYAGATGKYTVTLQDTVREVVNCSASIAANAAGDGAYAELSDPVNEGAANGTPITFTLWSFNAGGTPTTFTGRRVRMTICMKQTLLGS